MFARVRKEHSVEHEGLGRHLQVSGFYKYQMRVQYYGSFCLDYLILVFIFTHFYLVFNQKVFSLTNTLIDCVLLTV